MYEDQQVNCSGLIGLPAVLLIVPGPRYTLHACYTNLQNMLHYTTLCYAILHYAILRYALLRYVIEHFATIGQH